ncbi:MAG: hypothetical protein MHM6MM_002014 [Cercozoa sp. M6MM]
MGVERTGALQEYLRKIDLGEPPHLRGLLSALMTTDPTCEEKPLQIQKALQSNLLSSAALISPTAATAPLDELSSSHVTVCPRRESARYVHDQLSWEQTDKNRADIFREHRAPAAPRTHLKALHTAEFTELPPMLSKEARSSLLKLFRRFLRQELSTSYLRQRIPPLLGVTKLSDEQEHLLYCVDTAPDSISLRDLSRAFLRPVEHQPRRRGEAETELPPESEYSEIDMTARQYAILRPEPSLRRPKHATGNGDVVSWQQGDGLTSKLIPGKKQSVSRRGDTLDVFDQIPLSETPRRVRRRPGHGDIISWQDRPLPEHIPRVGGMHCQTESFEDELIVKEGSRKRATKLLNSDRVTSLLLNKAVDLARTLYV